MSYIIKFNEDKFVVSGNNEILVLDYDKYYNEYLENNTIKQGLDLKGGIYIVLEVDL